jgi:hypothetical protein
MNGKEKGKKRHDTPQDTAYKYVCPKGHDRIERQLIEENPLPYCTKCHMTTGDLNRIALNKKLKLPTLYRKGERRKKTK